jgi:DNA-directed RNA polymerase subunit L
MFSNYKESGASLMTDATKKERAAFTLAPSHTTIANTLVRIIQCKVPTVGFRTEPPEQSEVHIQENTTPLPNEMLAHRIGMIPIYVAAVDDFDSKKYRVELEVANPTQESRMVTTADMRIFVQDAEGWKDLGPEGNAGMFPVDATTKEPIMITHLRPQWSADSLEKIKLVAYPSVSTGEENVRYSPVCQCSYGHTIDTNAARQEEFFQNWLKESKKINEQSQVNPAQLNNLKREWATLEIQRCFLVDEENEPYSFDFEIETNGLMSVPAVVHRGIREIKTMLQKYQTLDMQIPANVRIQPTLGHRKGVEVIFDNTEDHTLGNLLQTYLVERHIMADQAPRLTYAGYKMGHPLKKELTLEIGSEADVEMTARRAIVAVIRFLLGLLDTMERDWLTITGTAAQLPELPPVPAAAADAGAVANEGIPPVGAPAPTATRGRGRGRGR